MLYAIPLNLLIIHQALVLLTHLLFSSSSSNSSSNNVYTITGNNNSSSIDLYRCKEGHWLLTKDTLLLLM
jgi:hypothetical protein